VPGTGYFARMTQNQRARYFHARQSTTRSPYSSV
jgi:hypothetical protein